MNVLAGIQIVEATDPDGRFIIDDGRHIAYTLRDLFVNWQSSKDIDANGNEWDPKLLDIFERGLTVHKVKYEDDTNRDYRQIWQSARHVESNDNVRYTSIFLIHEIGRKAIRCTMVTKTEPMPIWSASTVAPISQLYTDGCESPKGSSRTRSSRS